MPTYRMFCVCGWEDDVFTPIATRDQMCCPKVACHRILKRRISAPLLKFNDGRVTPGGGPDRFTADMLGIKTGDLPDYLKADYKP